MELARQGRASRGLTVDRARRKLWTVLPLLALSPVLLGPTRVWAAEKKRSGGEGYTPLPTLTATIVRPSGRQGVLTVESGLDVTDVRLRERADQSRPRLLDAYSQTLRRYGSALGPGRPPDADLIGRMLQHDTDRVLGRAGARLLLGTILVN